MIYKKISMIYLFTNNDNDNDDNDMRWYMCYTAAWGSSMREILYNNICLTAIWNNCITHNWYYCPMFLFYIVYSISCIHNITNLNFLLLFNTYFERILQFRLSPENKINSFHYITIIHTIPFLFMTVHKSAYT